MSLQLLACGDPTKPFRFKLYDFLILSAPVWAVIALWMSFDTGWRSRPRNWKDKRVFRSSLRRWYWRFSIARGVLIALAASGGFVLLLHMLDLLA